MESSPRSIVIGASAGGIEALQDVVSQLSAALPAPVCVVSHLAPYRPSALAELLNRAGPLPAMYPSDGTPLEPGIIYV